MLIHTVTINFRTPAFKCAVTQCNNTFLKYDHESLIKYHNFPQNVNLQKLWQEKCGMLQNYDDDVKVCSDHFLCKDYEFVYNSKVKNNERMGKLRLNAVPTRNLQLREPSSSLGPHLLEIRKVVDENESLSEKLENLLKEKHELTAKLLIYDKILHKRKSAIIKAKKQYDKLKKKINGCKEQKNLLAKVFSDSQIGVLLGRSKVIWSNNDLAMAFTLRQMGSKDCYLYLKETLNIPLPALSCVQKWVASKPTKNI